MEKFLIDIAKKIWIYVIVFGGLLFFLKKREISDIKNSDYFLFVKYKSGEEVDQSLFLDKNAVYFALYKAIEVIKKLNNNILLSKDDLVFVHKDINRFPMIKYVVLMSLDLNKKFDEYKINDGDMRLQHSPWVLFIDSYRDMKGVLMNVLNQNIEDDFETLNIDKDNIQDSEGLDGELDVIDEIYD